MALTHLQIPSFNATNEVSGTGKRPPAREIDSSGQKRARRMFGSLLGTLAKARCISLPYFYLICSLLLLLPFYRVLDPHTAVVPHIPSADAPVTDNSSSFGMALPMTDQMLSP